MPVKNLDHLFSLSFDEVIAAPRAYWLKQPWVSSLLLVIKPSLSLWHRAEQHFKAAGQKKLYDMDIINIEFKKEIYYLPDEYGCLNSEWEDKNSACHFENPEKSYKDIYLVHFSALGKPWFYHPDKILLLRPNAYPGFYILWKKWWALRDLIIKESPLSSKLKYYLLKYMCQKNKLKRLKSVLTFK